MLGTRILVTIFGKNYVYWNLKNNLNDNQKKMSHTKSALLTEISVLVSTKHSLTYLSTKKPGNQVRFQVDTGSECN